MLCEDKSPRASNPPAVVGWPGDRTYCDCSVQGGHGCPLVGHLPHRAPIGWPYQVAASPVKMCQLESEGAGVSAVRSSWRENSSVPVGPVGDRRDEY